MIIWWGYFLILDILLILCDIWMQKCFSSKFLSARLCTLTFWPINFRTNRTLFILKSMSRNSLSLSLCNHYEWLIRRIRKCTFPFILVMRILIKIKLRFSNLNFCSKLYLIIFWSYISFIIMSTHRWRYNSCFLNVWIY